MHGMQKMQLSAKGTKCRTYNIYAFIVELSVTDNTG